MKTNEKEIIPLLDILAEIPSNHCSRLSKFTKAIENQMNYLLINKNDSF